MAIEQRLGAEAATMLVAAEKVFEEVLPLAEATDEAVHVLQRRKLGVLLAFVHRYVPFFSELDAYPCPDVTELPTIDKASLMAHLAEACAEPGLNAELWSHIFRDEGERPFALFRDRYYIRRTSGTTGDLGYFLWDGPMGNVAEKSATRFVPAPSAMPKPVVAVNPVVVWHPLQAVFERLHNIPPGTDLESAIKRLHELRPRTIMGSPAFVAELAEAQIEGRLRIQPAMVIVGAAYCAQHQREQIRLAWSVDPLEQYGLSEAGLIASRCGAGNFHIHADTVILEMLDEAGRPAAPGHTCARMLLTRLFGPMQPVMRYEVGDMIVVGPRRCPCGLPFPTIARILGRTKPQLWLPSRSGSLTGVSAYTLMPAVEATPGIVRYQIRYERPDVLEVSLLASEPVDEAALCRRLRDRLIDLGATPPRIAITSGAVPSVWAAPHTTKDHHLRISVTRDQALSWISS